MRPIWKGAISFGLISIPVKLFSAVESKSLKFHLLHEADGGRIKYKRECAKCGKEVTWDDIIKGYEYSKDHYVTFTDEELESLEVESIKAIDVVTFVPLEDIDPIYFNKTYYVVPDASGIKAYQLLAEALEAEGQVGVAKVALRDKEHLSTIRLEGRRFRSRDHALARRDPRIRVRGAGQEGRGARPGSEDGSPAHPAAIRRVQARGVRGRVPDPSRKNWPRRRSRAKR